MFTIKRIRRMLALGSAVLLGAVLAPTTAPAQARIELTPFVGSYYPLASMCSDCFKDGTNFVGRQVSAASLGARVTYWPSQTIGVQGTFAYSPSRVQERFDSAGFGVALWGRGRIILASGRVLFRPARTNLFFLAGAGIVSRGDTVWVAVKTDAKDGVGAKLTSPAGVLGAGARASVTPKLSLDIFAELDLYSFDPRFNTGSSSANGGKLQSDLLVSVGIPIRLVR